MPDDDTMLGQNLVDVRNEGRRDRDFGPALCAHTEYECDCDCGCYGYGGDANHECDWPDCGCDCKPGCKGCELVQETAQ